MSQSPAEDYREIARRFTALLDEVREEEETEQLRALVPGLRRLGDSGASVRGRTGA